MDIRYYNELSQLHKTLPATHTDPKKVVNFCLSSAKLVVSFGKANPHLLFAMLQSGTKETPALIRCLLAVYVCHKANNANEHFIQHILASVIASYWIHNNSSDNKRNTIAHLRRFIAEKKLNIWLDVVALHKVMFSKNALKYVNAQSLSSIQKRVLMASLLASYSDTEPYVKVISQCAIKANVNDREFLARLLLLFERPLPLSSVFYKDTPATILATDQEKTYLLLNEGNEPEHWVSADTVVHSTYPPSISLENYITALTSSFDIINARAGKSLLPHTYPVVRPPSSLTSIIDALQRSSVNINKLSQQINEHEAFRHFLLTSASHDNRLKLPVSNVKQAILTYGIERVGDMLVQFALIERLTQHDYPLRALSVQFCTIASHIASILCSKCNLSLTPQSASLIITFLCVPLFTLPGLKVRTTLPVRSSGYFQPDRTFHLALDNEWHDIAGELASKWHQTKRTRVMIHQSCLAHHQVSASFKMEHAVIQLSFGLARELLFTTEKRDQITTKQLHQLLTTLQLTTGDVKGISGELSDILWCPI